MMERIKILCSDIIKTPKLLLILLGAYTSFFLRIKDKAIKLKYREFDVNKSFIRWGDGETLSLLKMSFSYQKASIPLSKKLKEIFYYKGDKIILGMPIQYISKNRKETDHLRARIITRYYFNIYLDRSKYYGDAFYFINLGNLSIFKKIYANKKIFIVAKKETIDKAKTSDIKDMISGYQEIPSNNAYLKYKEIESAILKKIGITKNKNLIILISSGPTAKVLAYDLTINNNLICHDVGSYFDRNL